MQIRIRQQVMTLQPRGAARAARAEILIKHICVRQIQGDANEYRPG